MRVILDTNVIIDSIQDEFSAPARLIDAIKKEKISAIVSSPVMREYKRMLKKLIANKTYEQSLQEFFDKLEEVSPVPTQLQIDDEEDRKFFEAAIGGSAKLIITNDRHLLDIGQYKDIRVVRPTEALARLEESNTESSSAWQQFAKSIGIGVLVLSLIATPASAQQKNTEPIEVESKEAEIEKLNAEIASLKAKRDTVSHEASLINAQVKLLETQKAKTTAELSKTKSIITDLQSEQDQTVSEIADLDSKTEEKKAQLENLVRALYQADREPLLKVFLSSGTVSDVVTARKNLLAIQRQVSEVIADIRDQQAELEGRKEELLTQEEDLHELQQLQAAQQADIAHQEAEQRNFLALKQSEKAKFESKIAEANQARKEIEDQVFKLKGVGVELTLTDASDMARHASKLTGVRPALLMGILKVETNLGQNLGGGQFPADMMPSNREAFLRVAAKLGRDPATLPISAKPKYIKGWGGAMGPGQFMPRTWEGIEPRVAAMLNKPTADPYELLDAFVATGIFLADRGATTSDGEWAAINHYIGGPRWKSRGVTWYGDRVLAVASEYAKEGL